MATFIQLLIIASCLFTYFDATKNQIGKVPNEKRFTNMSAGMWVVGVCLLWIVTFPLYLFKRKELIQIAKEKPQKVSTTQRIVVLGFLGITFLFFLLNGIFSKNPEINLIRNGTMYGYTAPTIGEAFEEVFDSPEWESFNTDQGQQVVAFKGLISRRLHDKTIKSLGIDLNDFRQVVEVYKKAVLKINKTKVENLYDKGQEKAVAEEFLKNYVWKTGTPVEIQWIVSPNNTSFQINHMGSTAWEGYLQQLILKIIYT